MKVAQLCPILCYSMDYIVHGILQARILEWVALPFSMGSSQPRDWAQVSHTAGRFFISWATWEALQGNNYSESPYATIIQHCELRLQLCAWKSHAWKVEFKYNITLNLRLHGYVFFIILCLFAFKSLCLKFLDNAPTRQYFLSETYFSPKKLSGSIWSVKNLCRNCNMCLT